MDISPNTITSASPDSIKCICILFACSVPWTGKQGRQNKSDVFSCLCLLLCLLHFYSKYLNSYELVNNRTSVYAWMDVLKLRGACFSCQKSKTGNVSSCLETDVVWSASIGRLIFDCVWCVLKNVSKTMHHFGGLPGDVAAGAMTRSTRPDLAPVDRALSASIVVRDGVMKVLLNSNPWPSFSLDIKHSSLHIRYHKVGVESLWIDSCPKYLLYANDVFVKVKDGCRWCVRLIL